MNHLGVAEEHQAVGVGGGGGRVVDDHRFAVHVLRQLVQLVEERVSGPRRFRVRGRLLVRRGAHAREHVLVRDHRGAARVGGHGAAESAAAREEAARGDPGVAAHVLGGVVGVHDVAQRPRRLRRADDGVDVRTGPAPLQPGTVGAGAAIGQRGRGGGCRQLRQGRLHLVGHGRAARVHEQHAVGSNRRRQVHAVGHEHVDVALHRQHVHLAVARALIGDRVGERERRARGRYLQRADARPGAPVLGIGGLHAAARGLLGHPRLVLQPFGPRRVLPGEEVRHMMPVGAAVLGKGRGVARLHLHAGRRVVDVGRRLHIRLVEIHRVVHDGRDGQDFVMTGEVLRHRVEVARLWPAAFQIAVLEMRRRDLERVAHPLAGGESCPRVRCPRRRVRASVHEDRTVERAHELHVVGAHLARERILLLEDAGAAEARATGAAPSADGTGIPACPRSTRPTCRRACGRPR